MDKATQIWIGIVVAVVIVFLFRMSHIKETKLVEMMTEACENQYNMSYVRHDAMYFYCFGEHKCERDGNDTLILVNSSYFGCMVEDGADNMTGATKRIRFT